MRSHFAYTIPLALFAATSSAQDLTRRADSVMSAAESVGFSGVVRLERDGALILEKGYGSANRGAKIPFTPATVVQIGSNTKDFTAVAILQLHERGKLMLTDTIGKFFPGAPADKRAITINQLLHHRAGFPLGLGGDFEPVSREQLISNAMKFTLLFKPGERENYSNTGYSLLAAIIEKVSGKSYDVYVRDNILSPLELRRTGFLLPGFKSTDLAHGYARSGKDEGTMLAKAHAADGPYWNLRGNGGMLSTAGDMHVFYKALFESEKLLRASTRNIMFNPSEPIGLAGSDLVNFFLYERDPHSRTEMIIASTNAERKAPEVRRALAQVMGLPLDVGDDDGPEAGAVVEGKPPSDAVADVISQLIATINGGSGDALLAFVKAHFDVGEGSPKSETRVERLSEMHSNLGTLEIKGMSDTGDGPVRVGLRTSHEGPATLLVDIDRSGEHRIRRIGVMVGN